MNAQMTFKRYELKYMLTGAQAMMLKQIMREHMEEDKFGHSTIRNLYLDTDSFRLIRRSMEKPFYKEKLRVRSYGPARETDEVFVELKKKFDSVVYKRRLTLPCGQALDALENGRQLDAIGQIAREIESFRRFYGPTLRPAMFLSYDRDAFRANDGTDFRLTLDTNIRWRTDRLDLGSDCRGNSLLEPDQVLMELKTAGGIPLWMTHFLSEEGIRKVSYSKYGTAYTRLLSGETPAVRKHYA